MRIALVWVGVCGGLGVVHAAPQPKIEHGTLSGEVGDGDYDFDAAEATMKKSDAAMVGCYKKALAKNRALTATVALNLDISESGAVSKVLVVGVSGALERCVAVVAKKWKFAAATPPRDVTLTHTFELFTGELSPTEEITGREAHSNGPPPGAKPTMTFGKHTVQGALDAEIVRRVIRRNSNKIQHCYEKQLVVTPGLAGKITATFTVDATGKVTSSTSTGMKNTPVESCVAGIIASIQFPRPRSGEVKVVYPFTFRTE